MQKVCYFRSSSTQRSSHFSEEDWSRSSHHGNKLRSGTAMLQQAGWLSVFPCCHPATTKRANLKNVFCDVVATGTPALISKFVFCLAAPMPRLHSLRPAAGADSSAAENDAFPLQLSGETKTLYFSLKEHVCFKIHFWVHCLPGHAKPRSSKTDTLTASLHSRTAFCKENSSCPRSPTFSPSLKPDMEKQWSRRAEQMGLSELMLVYIPCVSHSPCSKRIPQCWSHCKRDNCMTALSWEQHWQLNMMLLPCDYQARLIQHISLYKNMFLLMFVFKMPRPLHRGERGGPALLLALASVNQVGHLQALSVDPFCLEFRPNNSKWSLGQEKATCQKCFPPHLECRW